MIQTLDEARSHFWFAADARREPLPTEEIEFLRSEYPELPPTYVQVAARVPLVGVEIGNTQLAPRPGRDGLLSALRYRVSQEPDTAPASLGLIPVADTDGVTISVVGALGAPVGEVWLTDYEGREPRHMPVAKDFEQFICLLATINRYQVENDVGALESFRTDLATSDVDDRYVDALILLAELEGL